MCIIKICISGGMGFVGSNTALYYAKNPNNKILLIDNLSRHTHNLFLFDSYSNVEFWEADLRDFKTLNMIIKSFTPEVVIHTAGQTAVTTSMIDPHGDFSNNVIGTVNLLECLRTNNLQPKFLFTSTNKVYGENVNKLHLRESGTRYELQYEAGINEGMGIDTSRKTPYGTSKLCADLYVQEYAKTYGIKSCIFRMSCIYGTRQFGVEDQGWISHFIFNALQDKVINIFGDGKQVRDILYVGDLVNAFDSYIKSTHLFDSNVFNIGGGSSNTLSLLELIELLEGFLDKKLKVRFHDWRPSDQKVYISDINKVSYALDWEPQTSVIDGIKKTFEWVKDYLEL